MRDWICAAVVRWIVPTNAVQDYFIGYESYNRVVGGPEPDVLHQDATPLLMHLIEDRAPRVHPLSAYHGDGKRIVLCGVDQYSDRTRVLAKVHGEEDPRHGSWYVLEFKGAQWHVTHVEGAYFK